MAHPNDIDGRIARLLEDPLVSIIMRADHVDRAQAFVTLRQAAVTLAGRAQSAVAPPLVKDCHAWAGEARS